MADTAGPISSVWRPRASYWYLVAPARVVGGQVMLTDPLGLVIT